MAFFNQQKNTMERRHSFSITSFIRKHRKTKENEFPVYLRITVDGKRSEFATKITVDQQKWNAAKGRVNGTHETSKRLNLMIGNLEHRAQDIYNQYLLHGKIVTAEIIKNEITGFDHKQRMLLASIAEHVHDMKTSEGHGYSSGTIKNWQVTERHLKDFIKVSYNAPDITFKELDHRFVTEFEIFARREWQCKTNAILKHIQRLKKVVMMAVNKGWIDTDPFINFHRKQERTHRTFLTKEELERIERKEFQFERLERVRDVFIFSCYTGLAFVDIEKLTQDNLVTGIDGKKWIYTFRQKTDTKSNIPLLPAALKIIEKYYTANDNYTNKLLPLITNIKTNAYLKEIADMCDIKKNLTFHMARHTFATTITLSNGVPIETVSNMLGHTKITTTQIYAKVLENKVSNDMMVLERELSINNKDRTLSQTMNENR
ncbi:site-specific integrase [Danxiaibacter flavus]|uniref:Site-specific integrase n=1 Tax=Danxiaibacter flavus TaxID=3049108 RepID=A0ABV3ZK93_9BACT|nr:site-specific integrase [Chitinophagaceae bacterium DXS]